MDKLLSVHQRKKASSKQAKTKEKPLKVVYISNPVKFKTSAAEFRALVQELTGQDADTPDPTRFLDAGLVGGRCLGKSDEVKSVEDQAVKVVPKVELINESPKQSSDVCYQYDDRFMQQMEEGFLPSSNIWYESAHFDVLTSGNAM